MGRVNQFLEERTTASDRDLGRLVAGFDGRLRCRNCRNFPLPPQRGLPREVVSDRDDPENPLLEARGVCQ
jgi:hypothetical protein